MVQVKANVNNTPVFARLLADQQNINKTHIKGIIIR